MWLLLNICKYSFWVYTEEWNYSTVEYAYISSLNRRYEVYSSSCTNLRFHSRVRAHEFYFCYAVLVVDGSCMFLGSLQFMFVVWEGMVVAIFMDSLKAKLNICVYLWAHSLPLCFPVYICYVCMFSMSYTHMVCVYMLSPSVGSNSL